MTKTILLFILFTVCITGAVTAQFNKGDILLGASLGINYNSSTGANTNSNSNISPIIAMAVGKKSVMGIEGSFSYGTSKSNNPDFKTTGTGYGASLFWRRYIVIKNDLGWYAEFNGGISGNKQVQELTGSKTTYNTTIYKLGFVPGLYYRILPKLILNADFGGANYSYFTTKSNNIEPMHSQQFSLSLLSYFRFGVDFIISKKST